MVRVNGELIRKYRKSKRISLETFAKEIGISLTFLSEIERGNKGGSIRTIKKIANITGYSLEELITYENKVE